MSRNATLLNTFAKGKPKETLIQSGQNTVIYTRVSTKEQAETNQSLETQKKYCTLYAEKNNLNVVGYFGGTYESAKTDERNEFNRMIKYVKNLNQRIGCILVYSLDRFSRTGDNAIYISSQLKKQGISIIAVTQPIDVSTVSGVLQQNIQFIFSKYDNDLRREKSVSGMKEKLLKGEWIGAAPKGYKYTSAYKSKNQVIEISDEGKILKKAFLWKINECLSNIQISERLSKLGLQIGNKRLSEIFRNPFYCGLITHTLLEGQTVKGKHQALISEEIFLQVNNMINEKHFGFKWSKEDEQTPLRRFLICEECGIPFTGYLKKKKLANGNEHSYYYYKCRTVGCNINRAVLSLHINFEKLLEKFQIKIPYQELIKKQLEMTYQEFCSSEIESQRLLKLKLSELNDKLSILEERFAYGEIDRSLYDKLSSKLKTEISEKSMELHKAGLKISNSSETIDKVIATVSQLRSLWQNGDTNDKKIVQNICFPNGLVFNGKNNRFRTDNINVVIDLTTKLSDFYEGNKQKKLTKNSELSCSVPRVGIEPTHLTVHDFESCASTSSAIQAFSAANRNHLLQSHIPGLQK